MGGNDGKDVRDGLMGGNDGKDVRDGLMGMTGKM